MIDKVLDMPKRWLKIVIKYKNVTRSNAHMVRIIYELKL